MLWIDMKKIYSIIYDRFGIKRNLLGLFFSKNSQAYASSHPKNLINEEKIDVLNLEQNNWKNPVDGKIKNKSINHAWENNHKCQTTISRSTLRQT